MRATRNLVPQEMHHGWSILCGVDPEEYMRYTARAALLKPGTAILPQEFARERALAGESPGTCSPYFSGLHTNT